MRRGSRVSEAKVLVVLSPTLMIFLKGLLITQV